MNNTTLTIVIILIPLQYLNVVLTTENNAHIPFVYHQNVKTCKNRNVKLLKLF